MWLKSMPILRSKRLKNYTPWGAKYLYSLLKAPPSPPAWAYNRDFDVDQTETSPADIYYYCRHIPYDTHRIYQ